MHRVPFNFPENIEPVEYSIGVNHEYYLEFEETNFPTIIDYLDESKYSLATLFGTHNFQGGKGIFLFYVFSKFNEDHWLIIKRSATNPSSVSLKFPSAVWSEREITDGFGVTFTGSIDTRRLFLHECYNEGIHPLLKSDLPHEIIAEYTDEEYQFRKFTGEGVYHIPVGPVHAGIIEPGHFRFSAIGETIFNLEVRMFYKHRGIEKFVEGKTPNEIIPIIGKISGDEIIGNTVAFCIAVEKIAEVVLLDKSHILRTIFLEMERLYSHLNDIAGMILDVSYAISSSQVFALREELFRWNHKITGHRFMRGAIVLGGVSSDIDELQLHYFESYLAEFMIRLEKAIKLALRTSTVLDRFESTGIVKSSLVRPLHLTGPIARASGISIDTRIDHPYGIYGELIKNAQIEDNGDVQARFNVKVQEVLTSAKLIILLVKQLPPGESSSIQFQPKDGYTLSAVEVSRGENVHFVSIKNGVIDRLKIRTASFYNWSAIEHAVIGNIVADFPLINKSMNLSYSGTDL